MNRRGQTLLEMMVGLSVFSFLIMAAFDMFALGTSQFQLSNGRLELQGEIRRINGALRRDMLGSCFTSISSDPINATVSLHPPLFPPETTMVTVSRDAISFKSIQDHTAPTYDAATQLTQFDMWTVYCPYTNYTADPNSVYDCKLYRYQISPFAGNISQLSMATMGIWASPAAGWCEFTNLGPPSGFSDLHCYSNRVRSFEILANPGDQTMQVTITLQAPLGRITTGKKQTAEIVSSSILLKSENTWPKL